MVEPKTMLMNEKTFYQDAQESLEKFSVAVETGLLRVDNDSYALAGVRDVRLDVALSPYDLDSSKSLNEKCVWACIFGVVAVVGSMMGQHLFLLFLVGAAVIGYFAALSRREAEVKRTFVAKIILLRVDGETPVKIGHWNRSPDEFAAGVIEKLGCNADLWRKAYNDGRHRAEAIAQAIGSAIKKQSFAGSL